MRGRVATRLGTRRAAGQDQAGAALGLELWGPLWSRLWGGAELGSGLPEDRLLTGSGAPHAPEGLLVVNALELAWGLEGRLGTCGVPAAQLSCPSGRASWHFRGSSGGLCAQPAAGLWLEGTLWAFPPTPSSGPPLPPASGQPQAACGGQRLVPGCWGRASI